MTIYLVLGRFVADCKFPAGNLNKPGKSVAKKRKLTSSFLSGNCNVKKDQGKTVTTLTVASTAERSI